MQGWAEKSTTNQFQPKTFRIDLVKAEDGGDVKSADYCYIGTIGDTASLFDLLFEDVQSLFI
jgi:hypothetical protein